MDEYKFRDLRFVDEDRQKTIKVGKDHFKIKAIFPADNRLIARMVVAYQAGQPNSAFANVDIARFERDATIATMVVDGPAWWRGVDNCPHEETLDLLWKGILDWTKEVQARLKKNQPLSTSPSATVSD